MQAEEGNSEMYPLRQQAAGPTLEQGNYVTSDGDNHLNATSASHSHIIYRNYSTVQYSTVRNSTADGQSEHTAGFRMVK